MGDGLTILTGRDGEIDSIIIDLREGEEDHRPGVPAASEGSLTQGAHDVLVDAGIGEGGQIRLQLEENLKF